MRPPLHPWLYLRSQSTSSCSDSGRSSPVLIALMPSIAPMLEKAQQLPAHSQPIRTSFHQAAVITDSVITTAFHHFFQLAMLTGREPGGGGEEKKACRIGGGMRSSPHEPWSLTAATAPFSRQSMESGASISP